MDEPLLSYIFILSGLSGCIVDARWEIGRGGRKKGKGRWKDESRKLAPAATLRVKTSRHHRSPSEVIFFNKLFVKHLPVEEGHFALGV